MGREDERPDLVGYVIYAPGKMAARPWWATRDVHEGSGAGWRARERIEALAFERDAGIGICTPLTDEVLRELDAMGPAVGELPPVGSLVTLFFGPVRRRAEAQAMMAADRSAR
jgi:hypothetical protein